MSAGEALDIGHLRAWIGREERASETLTPALGRRFLATFDAPQNGAGADPVVAPRLLHWCLAQPAALTSALGDDGHPRRGGFLPPVPLPRRMWAGGSLIFKGEARTGDVVTRTSRVADVVLKEGQSGPLCFVTVEHVVAAGGTVWVEERQDIVYRDSGPLPPAAPAAIAPCGRHCQRVVPTAALLFRYSALTFNGHRIHYDRPYASEVEGYDGLVVHGPLQATLLFRFAALLRGRPPDRFTFRGRSPLTDGADFLLHADAGGEGMTLWTAREQGPVAMSAAAAWTAA